MNLEKELVWECNCSNRKMVLDGLRKQTKEATKWAKLVAYIKQDNLKNYNLYCDAYKVKLNAKYGTSIFEFSFNVESGLIEVEFIPYSVYPFTDREYYTEGERCLKY